MRFTRLSAVLVLGVSPLVAGAAPAQAEVADPHSSCAGLALSGHATSDGPGAVAAILVEVKDAADAFGFDSSGQIVSRFANVHAGTHVPGCEDAFYLILTEGP